MLRLLPHDCSVEWLSLRMQARSPAPPVRTCRNHTSPAIKTFLLVLHVMVRTVPCMQDMCTSDVSTSCRSTLHLFQTWNTVLPASSVFAARRQPCHHTDQSQFEEDWRKSLLSCWLQPQVLHKICSWSLLFLPFLSPLWLVQCGVCNS